MNFRSMLTIVGDEPVFESAALLAGGKSAASLRRQLVRWVDNGRLLQVRRGLYALAPPYRKTVAHPFLVAEKLIPGCAVSLESALAFHGLIPEAVFVTTTVGPGRPRRFDTPLGRYEHRHLAPRLRFGNRWTWLAGGQGATLATPEKALLDLVHLVPGADDPAYLAELRLQSLERLDPNALLETAERFRSPKVLRAAHRILALRNEEMSDLVAL